MSASEQAPQLAQHGDWIVAGRCPGQQLPKLQRQAHFSAPRQMWRRTTTVPSPQLPRAPRTLQIRFGLAGSRLQCRLVAFDAGQNATPLPCLCTAASCGVARKPQQSCGPCRIRTRPPHARANRCVHVAGVARANSAAHAAAPGARRGGGADGVGRGGCCVDRCGPPARAKPVGSSSWSVRASHLVPDYVRGPCLCTRAAGRLPNMPPAAPTAPAGPPTHARWMPAPHFAATPTTVSSTEAVPSLGDSGAPSTGHRRPRGGHPGVRMCLRPPYTATGLRTTTLRCVTRKPQRS